MQRTFNNPDNRANHSSDWKNSKDNHGKIRVHPTRNRSLSGVISGRQGKQMAKLSLLHKTCSISRDTVYTRLCHPFPLLSTCILPQSLEFSFLGSILFVYYNKTLLVGNGGNDKDIPNALY